MAALVPRIDSVVNGLVTVSILDPNVVLSVFDQLLVLRSESVNGPFTTIATFTLDSRSIFTVLDAGCAPRFLYKARFFNSTTLAEGVDSALAQETNRFSEFSVPTNTATYPPEIALSEEDLEIVESIRVTLGDLGSIERDVFDSKQRRADQNCTDQISFDGCTWELTEPKGWPRRVVLNGEHKFTLLDPQVLGYRFLVFSGTSPCITGSLDVFYNHFRFSDREILTAFDRSVNLMTASCNLSAEQITKEMRIMQASILLLEGEIRDLNSPSSRPFRIRDGDTEFDSTEASNLISDRTRDLADLKEKMREFIRCATWEVSYGLEGVRVD